ncbi:immunity protein [Photorhabdus tasmaniensis]|uniref:immunity protein n=1 Tax=Photorhabdus tasmaniensis TaxID=1004159 RepID=UPI004042C980
MKDIRLMMKLAISFFFLITFALLFIRLGVAVIFFLRDGHFYFEWANNTLDSVRRGGAIGLPLGVGIWILSRLKENRGNKTPPSDR